MASIVEEARAFFALPELAHIGPERLRDVLRQIAVTGSYEHSVEELLIGARLAWRNHARCIGRYAWRGLQIIDARHCRTHEEMAQACWDHLRISTNGGALRAVVTVFAPQLPDGRHPRIWNPQLVRYAGYRQPDGSVVGDPLHADLTERVQRLGWRGAGGPFDVLPVLIEPAGQPVRLFEVPPEVVLEVPITHPELPWFAELGLRWHANPAISNMCLDVGGLRYTAAPFSGWYVSSEIGARNFSDVDRYDLLPVVAERMGLDTSTNRSLWRDRALVELNQAVLYSYRKAGVHILDHHTAAQQFITHVDRETAAGRKVPAQWSWVNPPLSASTTPTYHREYDFPDFELRPNWVYQDRTPALPAPAGISEGPAA